MRRKPAKWKRLNWQPKEIRLLRRLYPGTPTVDIARRLGRPLAHVYAAANNRGLKKSAEYLAGPWAGRIEPGSTLGAGHRFRKGHVPANKGMRMPGWAPGRMAETQFKKGTLNGRALQVVKPIGTERISKDGYLERKINNDMPFQKRWRAVHLLVWEKRHGPLPAGHCVIFKDGNKQNRRLSNLQLMSRADNCRRNSYHNYPKEIGRLVQLRGALTRQINKRTRQTDEQHDRGSPGTVVRHDQAAQGPGKATGGGSRQGHLGSRRADHPVRKGRGRHAARGQREEGHRVRATRHT